MIIHILTRSLNSLKVKLTPCSAGRSEVSARTNRMSRKKRQPAKLKACYSPNNKKEGQMPHCTSQDKQSLSVLFIEWPKYTGIWFPKPDNSKKTRKPQLKELQESYLRFTSSPPPCISCHKLYIRSKINNPNKPALTFAFLISFLHQETKTKKRPLNAYIKAIRFGKIFTVLAVVKSLIQSTFSSTLFLFKCFLQLFWFYSQNSASSKGFLLILPHKFRKMPTIINAYSFLINLKHQVKMFFSSGYPI